MNAWDREVATLSFSNEGLDRGCIEESMYPWDKTVANWKEQGYDTVFWTRYILPPCPPITCTLTTSPMSHGRIITTP